MDRGEANPSDEAQRHVQVRVDITYGGPEELLAAGDAAVIRHKKPDPPELTELHGAIEAKNRKKVKELVRGGVDVNALHSNYDLGFPLMHALDIGDTGIIRALLEAGADPNRADYLAYAIEENDLPVAKLLIAHGAELNGQPTWEKDEEFETNLIRATRLGRTSFVKLLLESGADPNLHDANDESALLVARLAKNSRLVKLIAPYVSDAERAWVEERFSKTYAERIKLDGEIRQAIRSGQVERVVELFKTTGRPLDTPLDPEFLYPLEEAIGGYCGALGRTRPRVVGSLEDFKDNDPNYENPAVLNMLQVVHALIDFGAQVDKGVYTPPLWGVTSMGDRNVDVLLRMLEKPCDIDARTTMDRETPLMGASLNYQVALTRVLLAHGADPNARNIRGESVLQRARHREQYLGPNPCVALLLEAGARE